VAAWRVQAAVAAASCARGREKGWEAVAGADRLGRVNRPNLRRFKSDCCKLKFIYEG
jgi:hypothetical protein